MIIETQYDFTPKGKRVARVVRTRGGSQLRWYVGGRLFVKGAAADRTTEWLAGEGGEFHLPQSWEALGW